MVGKNDLKIYKPYNKRREVIRGDEMSLAKLPTHVNKEPLDTVIENLLLTI